MRKSLLVLLVWAQAVTANIQAPSIGNYPQHPQPLGSETLKAIQRFLLHDRILDTSQELDSAPYIVGAQAGRVLGANGERIYARGALDPAQPSYGIFRQGKVFTDPDSQELLGINADDIGTARVVMVGDVTTLAVQRVTQEVRPGIVCSALNYPKLCLICWLTRLLTPLQDKLSMFPVASRRLGCLIRSF